MRAEPSPGEIHLRDIELREALTELRKRMKFLEGRSVIALLERLQRSVEVRMRRRARQGSDHQHPGRPIPATTPHTEWLSHAPHSSACSCTAQHTVNRLAALHGAFGGLTIEGLAVLQYTAPPLPPCAAAGLARVRSIAISGCSSAW